MSGSGSEGSSGTKLRRRRCKPVGAGTGSQQMARHTSLGPESGPLAAFLLIAGLMLAGSPSPTPETPSTGTGSGGSAGELPPST